MMLGNMPELECMCGLSFAIIIQTTYLKTRREASTNSSYM